MLPTHDQSIHSLGTFDRRGREGDLHWRDVSATRRLQADHLGHLNTPTFRLQRKYNGNQVHIISNCISHLSKIKLNPYHHKCHNEYILLSVCISKHTSALDIFVYPHSLQHWYLCTSTFTSVLISLFIHTHLSTMLIFTHLSTDKLFFFAHLSNDINVYLLLEPF